MLVVIKLVDALGDVPAGETIQIDEEKAKKLVDAGLAEYAEAGDSEGDDSEGDEEPALIENSAKRLIKRAEKAVETAVQGAAKKIYTDAIKPSEVPNNLYATATADPTFGYKSFGHYVFDFIGKNGDSGTRRIKGIRQVMQKTNPTAMAEGTANAGQELVPQYWSDQLFSKVWTQDDAISRCTPYPMKSNIENVPVVQSQENGTTGILSYYATEANQITASNLPTDNAILHLDDLYILTNISGQLSQDNPYALETFLRMHAPTKLRYEINKAIFRTGGTHQVHLLTNAATVAVHRATNGTVQFADLSDMYNAMWPDSVGNGVWFVTTSAYTKFLKLAFPDSDGIFPVTLFGGFGDQLNAPRPTYMGCPVVRMLNLPALGTKGDVVFADMSQIAMGKREIQSDMTPYLYFDRNLNTLRFWFRYSTASLWTAPFVDENSNSYSPFVVLDVAGS